MCTLQSEERGIWEETPSGNAQVGGEVSYVRLLVREQTLIQLCSMATTKVETVCSYLAEIACQLSSEIVTELPIERQEQRS
jgi:hypothetical protein